MICARSERRSTRCEGRLGVSLAGDFPRPRARRARRAGGVRRQPFRERRRRRRRCRAPPHRIVSLVPSMTEDLFAVGAGGRRSSACRRSPTTRREPGSCRSRRVVRVDRRRNASSRCTPISSLGIVAQDRLVGDLRRAGIQVMLLHDDSYDDIFANLLALGMVTGHRATPELRGAPAGAHRGAGPLGQAAQPHAVRIRRAGQRAGLHRRQGLVHRHADRAWPAGATRRPTSPRPTRATARRRSRAPARRADRRRPRRAPRRRLGQPPWSALRAVKQHRVYTLPDAAILERPGPRYNDGLAWLIATIDRAAR